MNVNYIEIYQELSNSVYPKNSQKLLSILTIIITIVLFAVILLFAMVGGLAMISTKNIENKPKSEKCYYDNGLLDERTDKETIQLAETIYTECWENSQRFDLMNIFTYVLKAWILLNFFVFFSKDMRKIFKKIEQEEVDKLTEFVLLRIISPSQKGLNYRQIKNLQSHAKDIQGSADWRGGIIGGFILSIFTWVLSSPIIAQVLMIQTYLILKIKTRISIESISNIVIFLVIIVIVTLIIYFVYQVTEYIMEYILGEKINRIILYTCNQSLSVLQSIEIEEKKIEEITKPSEYRCKVAKFLGIEDIILNECTSRQNRFNFFQWMEGFLTRFFG